MGLILAVESPLPHLIGGEAGEFRNLLERVPTARVCLDTSHTTLGHQWERFVDVAGPRLIHVHANDHRGQYDDHLPPGDGIIDWQVIGNSLQKLDFTGWLMLELNSSGGASADSLGRARDQLRSVLEGAGRSFNRR